MENIIIDALGNKVVEGEMIAFQKTINKVRVFVHSYYRSLEDGKINVEVFGFSTSPENVEMIKSKIKKNYTIKLNSNFYKLVKKNK